MIQYFKTHFLHFYIIIVLLSLFVSNSEDILLISIVKPLIVISLMLKLIIDFNFNLKYKSIKIFLLGLWFSLIGDISLIFQEDFIFFVVGLLSFLLAHLFYIYFYILTTTNTVDKKLKYKTPFILLMITVGILSFLMFYDYLDNLKIPVFIYITALVSMNIFALNRYGSVNRRSFTLIMVGALFFLISDGILAINKFCFPFEKSGILIMLTYGIAQYLITKGAICNYEINNKKN